MLYFGLLDPKNHSETEELYTFDSHVSGLLYEILMCDRLSLEVQHTTRIYWALEIQNQNHYIEQKADNYEH